MRDLKREEARLIMAALEEFRKVNPYMSVLDILTLLRIHLTPEITLTQLQDEFDVERTMYNKLIYRLERGRTDKPDQEGLQLLAIDIPVEDRRQREVTLNAKGKKIMQRVAEAIEPFAKAVAR